MWTETPVQAERSPLYAVGKARLVIVGQLIASRFNSGHALALLVSLLS